MDASPCYRWATFALIAIITIGRLLYLAFWCPFDLAPDEAHYWDWSRRLDWCYYSKGPLIAWLIRASCAIFGDTMFAVRLPAVVCGSLLLLGLHTLMRQVHRSEQLAFTAVALASTLPIVAAGSLLMTIDAPFTCAWMWALVFSFRAVRTPDPLAGRASDGLSNPSLDPLAGRASDGLSNPSLDPLAGRASDGLSNPSLARPANARLAWPAAGLCVLVGVLAKHTMVLFVPSLALFLATTPSMRHHLKRPAFWIMTSIGALGGMPILIWNAAHDWVTFRHAHGHAGLDEATWHWLGPLKYLGGQGAILLGFWFLVWLWAMWTQRPTREERPPMRFLWWLSLPTFVFFGLFSFTNGGGEPNWPIVAYLSGLVLAAEKLSAVSRQPSAKAGILGTAALGLLATIALHGPMLMQPVLLRLASAPTPEQPTPLRRLDPTARLRGWRTLAAEVDRVRAELRSRGIEPVLACERWTQAGELAFYCEGMPRVHSLGVWLGDRHCQYDLWRPNPPADAGSFRERTFILVGIDRKAARRLFESLEWSFVVEYREQDALIGQWTLSIAHGLREMPTEGIDSY